MLIHWVCLKSHWYYYMFASLQIKVWRRDAGTVGQDDLDGSSQPQINVRLQVC